MNRIETKLQYEQAYKRIDDISTRMYYAELMGPGMTPSCDGEVEEIIQIEDAITEYEERNNLITECCHLPLIRSGCYQCSVELEDFV